jgi:hypothetical protein
MISEQIHDGVGIAVVRGLDNAQFDDEQCIIAFAGIAAHVCPERASDAYANQTLSALPVARDIIPCKLM